MKAPKISIVIPSFNKVKYIGKTLDSIISQNYHNLEVIIQDGGSTDGTLGVIKEYASKYPGVIKYESGRDGGQLDAINKGLRKSKGEIVTYINADDYYLPGAFNNIAKLSFDNPRADWFAGKGRVVDGKGHEIVKVVTFYKNLLLFLNSNFLLLITNYLMQPSVFLKRVTWNRFGPFSGTSNFVMEYDLWLKIAKYKMPVVSNNYLSNFRIEASTISKNYTNELLSEDEKIVRKYTRNPLMIGFHKLHNYGRRLIGWFI